MPPPRIPKLSKEKKAAEPTTASEFLDAGVDDEEHGDRWIDSGDIPKAIRFYQKPQVTISKLLQCHAVMIRLSAMMLHITLRVCSMWFTLKLSKLVS